MRVLVLNGIYQHYKGQYYKVLYLAKHSETLEDLVVYQAQYGDHKIWVRPLGMFLETISIDGEKIERFSYIAPDVQTELSIELDDESERSLYENNIDLAFELRKKYPEIKCHDTFSSDGSKSVGLSVLCYGASAALVILAISKLLAVIFHKPHYVDVKEFNSDGKIVKQHTELLQPDTPNSAFSVTFEIDAAKATLKIEDRKE